MKPLFFVLLLVSSFCSANVELAPLIDEIEHALIDREAPCPYIVAIGGCPGVGKSTITKTFQTELAKRNIRSVIFSLDHYRMSQEERKQFTNELDPRRLRWEKLHAALIKIKNGALEITKPTVNQLTTELGEETLYLEGIDCILFDGAYALNNLPPMNYLQYADLAVYLEASIESIYCWKWERDLKKTTPRTSHEFFHHMQLSVEDFAIYIYPTRKNAHFIIHIDPLHHYSVLKNDLISTFPTPDFTEFRLQALNHYKGDSLTHLTQ